MKFPGEGWVPLGAWLKGPFGMLPVEISVVTAGADYAVKLRRMGQRHGWLTLTGSGGVPVSMVRMGAAVLCPEIVGVSEDASDYPGQTPHDVEAAEPRPH